MKAKHVILYLLLAIVSSSCIGEEALNAEADILSCALPGVAMTTSPIINNNSITIFVGPGTDISELTPEFTLTPGATINPLSGTERNFNTPQEYTVTAADGVWKKTYIISVIDTELATNYNFEDTLGGKKYYIFVEREGGKVVMEWASGNAGYAMTGVAKTADDSHFPNNGRKSRQMPFFSDTQYRILWTNSRNAYRGRKSVYRFL